MNNLSIQDSENCKDIISADHVAECGGHKNAGTRNIFYCILHSKHVFLALSVLSHHVTTMNTETSQIKLKTIIRCSLKYFTLYTLETYFNTKQDF